MTFLFQFYFMKRAIFRRLDIPIRPEGDAARPTLLRPWRRDKTPLLKHDVVPERDVSSCQTYGKNDTK